MAGTPTLTSSEEEARRRSRERRHPHLVLSGLVLILVLFPYLDRGWLGQVLVLITLIWILGSNILVLGESRSGKIIGLYCGIPALILGALHIQGVLTADWPIALATIGAMVLGVMSLRALFGHMQRYQERVTPDILSAAVAGYLLLGFIWTLAYFLVYTFDPGAFPDVMEGGRRPVGDDLMYFSFVTLSTLGYGDITPATMEVRSLAMLEAIAGPLYLAILIARLVSLYRPGNGKS